MAYRFQSSYSEAENQEFSYSSGMGSMGMGSMGMGSMGMGSMGMGCNSLNSQHALGSSWGGNQMAGYSGYGHGNSAYGMGLNNGYGYGGGELASSSSYAMNQQSGSYSGNHCYDPCKRFF